MRYRSSTLIYASLALLFSSALFGLANAQPTTGFQGDLGADHGEGGTDNPIYVLVAYDEEMWQYDYWWRNRYVSTQEYTSLQNLRVLARFPWQYVIAGYENFTSPDDAPDMDTLLISMETQLGWTHGSYNGKVVNGHYCSILIGWTNQQVYGYSAGVAHFGKGATLTRYQVDWADDNTLQEEVSHLYGYALAIHCLADDCVMSQQYKVYYDVWESLWPVEEGGYWVAIYNWEMVGYFSTTWCSPHYDDLRASHGHPISSLTSASIISEESIHQPLSSPSPQPKKDALNPPNYWIPYALGIIVILIVVAVVLYLILRKPKKQVSTRSTLKPSV